MVKFENITNIFSNSCINYADENLCKFFGSKLSYSETLDLVNKFTKGLQSIGVKKGTKVGLFLPNCPAFIVAYYAILQAGATIVNYNPLYSEEEVYHQTQSANPEFIITINITDLYGKIESISKKDDVNFKVIVCTLFGVISTLKDWVFWFKQYSRMASIHYNSSVIKFSSLLNLGSDFTPVDISEEDVALIQYSGGTTGEPKGILLTHANLMAAIEEPQFVLDIYIEKYGKDYIRNILAILPLYHVFAMLVTLNVSVRNGLTCVLVPKFSPESLLETIKSEKINVAAFVPTILLSILKSSKLSSYELSSLKVIFCGGAPLAIQLYDDARKCFSNVDIFQGYGLSETTSIVSLNYQNKDTNPTSAGHPTKNTKVSIRDLEDDKKELKVDEVGEICVKGPQVMKTYLTPEDNKNVFVDGYFKTGDVGYLDKTGAINIVDRIKDLILRRGFNVFPSEIECVIRECESVLDVAVIGVKNERLQEEIPKAIIQLKDGFTEEQSRDEIIDHCREKLAAIKMPKIFNFVLELPKTPIGKVDKKKLKVMEINKNLSK